jgi:hypothetical protein
MPEPISPIQPFHNFCEAYYVKSHTQDKVTYLVALDATSSEWACSCPAWVYGLPRANCKHIKSVLKWRKQTANVPLLLPAKVTRFSTVDV